MSPVPPIHAHLGSQNLYLFTSRANQPLGNSDLRDQPHPTPHVPPSPPKYFTLSSGAGSSLQARAPHRASGAKAQTSLGTSTLARKASLGCSPFPGPVTAPSSSSDTAVLQRTLRRRQSVWVGDLQDALAVSSDPSRLLRGPLGTAASEPSRRSLPARSAGGPGRTQRDPGQEGGGVQRPGRGAQDHARVVEEIWGALAQAVGRPNIIQAQEAAAPEGQAPAALGVVHGGGGAQCGAGSECESGGGHGHSTRHRPALPARSGCSPLGIPCVTSPSSPAPSDHANKPAADPMGGQDAPSLSSPAGGRAGGAPNSGVVQNSNASTALHRGDHLSRVRKKVAGGAHWGS